MGVRPNACFDEPTIIPNWCHLELLAAPGVSIRSVRCTRMNSRAAVERELLRTVHALTKPDATNVGNAPIGPTGLADRAVLRACV